jgi:hypothetical protein
MIIELGEIDDLAAVCPHPDRFGDRAEQPGKNAGILISALSGDESGSFTHGKSPSFAGNPASFLVSV